MGNWMKRLLAIGSVTVTILFGFITVSSAASISGNIAYTGSPATGTLYVGMWTDSSMQSEPIKKINIVLPPSVFPTPYVLQNVSDGTYYVGAFLDVNGNTEPEFDEPWGAYGIPDPISIIGGSSVIGKDFTLAVKTSQGNSISGNISYTGTTAGRLKIEAFDNANFMGVPIRSIICDGYGFPFNYYLDNLTDGTYYITAYVDSNYNNFLDGFNEPSGKYSNTPGGPPDAITVGGDQSVSDKHFTLTDPGQIPPPLASSGMIILDANGYDFSASTTSAWSVNADIRFTTAFGSPSQVEVYSGYINSLGPMDLSTINSYSETGTTSHITPVVGSCYTFRDRDNKPVAIRIENISTLPYSPYTPEAVMTFSYRYDYVMQVGPPFTLKLAIGTDTTPTAEAKVVFFDTKGDWNKDNDVLISSGTTTGSYTTEGSNKYNVVLNIGTPQYNTSTGSPYEYAIYIVKTDKRMEDRRIYFNSTMPSTLYTNWITGSNYIILRDAPEVTVDQLGIKIGDTTAATGTISPDNDGTNDFCEIMFKYTIAGATDSWEKGGQARICIDTNGSDSFEPFDYSKFFWDENGGPYYDISAPATWNWDKFQQAKDAGTLSQYKLTQQEFDAMRAGTDWSMDQWIDCWQLDANNSITQSVRWEGRDNSWNVVPAGTYGVQIQVDNPNWSTEDGISFTDNTTLTITVTGAGISGTVTDDQGNPVAGIRVNAGSPPPGGWGSTFTKANGTYVISGLSPGTYHVNTESGATGFPNKDYPQEVPVTAGNITSGINFTLERGGAISGTITIPAPGFVKFPDPWNPNSYCTRGWLNIEAWSPNSPQHGWAGFDVEDDELNEAQLVPYTLNLPAGTYNVSARMEGYASESYKEQVVVTGEITTLNISMSKAGSISGTVSLPDGVTASDFMFVDISANSSDGKYFGWGGVSISSGTTSAEYQIRGLPNATYKVKYNIWGRYKPGESASIIIPDTSGNKDITGVNYTFDLGAKVFGKLQINGDTSQYQDGGMGPGSGPGGENDFYVWINCWSSQTGYGTGTQVKCTKQTASQEVDYEIGGLEPGKTYQIECWLFGFEMVGWPLKVTIPSNSTEVNQNIVLNPYDGYIAGTVTGTKVDYDACRVTVREPWWGDREPRYSDVDSNGAFKVTGLGTGEYIVTCNEYYVKPSSSMPLGVPTGDFGTVMERIPLANGQSLDGATLVLSAGAKITGTISITSAVYNINDLDGKVVTAVPMRMQWMGWVAPYRGQVRVISGVATYSIDGLSDDIYVVTPPIYMEQKQSSWGQPEPDLAGEKRVVAVTSGGTSKNVNFTLTDGYTITGTLQRPVSGQEEHFYLSLQRAGGGWDEITGTNVDFANWGPEKQDLDKRSLSFSFKHIHPNKTGENYVIRINTPDYKVANKEVTVVDKNVDVGTVSVTKGATIKGKILDAETGQAISGDNGIEVICEARPWVEGSWRSTNEWQGSSGSGSWEEQNSIKTGVFRLKNLPAGNYIVRIYTSGSGKGGKTSTTTKNYVSMYMAGIVVPDSTEEVDIGNIKLRGGNTISGKVTDTLGNPLPNVWMEATPSAAKGESVVCKATTDAAGNYVIEGIDPLIAYWDITAAVRPWWGEGIRVRYGEKWKDNISPGTIDINFELELATANLTGKVIAPQGVELYMPFSGEEMSVAYLILQDAEEAYTDPMDGIEQVTSPDGSFNIQGIVPGTYNLKVFSKGSATAIVPNITIAEGANSAGEIQLVVGGTVHGTIKTTDGKNINTSMFEIPLAMKADFSSMVFGTFNSNEVTKEIESYTVEGLEAGGEYYVVLAAEEGADIFISTPTVTLSSATESKEHNITYRDLPPNFLVSVYKNAESKFVINIWATETLMEDDAADIVSLKNSSADDGVSEGTLSDFVMSADHQEVAVIYTPAASDIQCTLTITGHDLVGQQATPVDYTFGVGVDAFSKIIFNPMIGGTLDVGENAGDSTKMKFPGGAIESTDNVEGTLSKVQSVGATVTITGAPLSMKAYPTNIVQANRAPKPARGEKVSPYYEVNIGSSQIAEGKSAKISLQYTPADVSDISKIDVYSFDGTKWVAEKDGRKVDTVNHTISVNVTHTSLFAVYETEGEAPTTYTGDFKVYMYPSPFKPKTDLTAYFRVKLPATLGAGNTVKIKIYNIAGELVRELQKSIDGGTQDTIDWDAKNDGGEAVASGVYIYRLTLNDDEKQIEKIAVIK